MATSFEDLDLDVNKLLKAVDDDSCDYLMGLTSLKIRTLNLEMLKMLKLPKKYTKAFMGKLEGYKYIDSLDEIKYGRYIKWTDVDYVKDTVPKLASGGIVCEVKIGDSGINIVCKNFMHKYFQIVMDECMIFQKLSSQELVLLAALDHLDNNDGDYKYLVT